MTNDEKVEQMPVNPDTLKARFGGEENYPVYRDF